MTLHPESQERAVRAGEKTFLDPEGPVHDFTDEELAFIPSTMLRAGINCGIKYRLGQDGEEEAE